MRVESHQENGVPQQRGTLSMLDTMIVIDFIDIRVIGKQCVTELTGYPMHIAYYASSYL